MNVVTKAKKRSFKALLFVILMTIVLATIKFQSDNAKFYMSNAKSDNQKLVVCIEPYQDCDKNFTAVVSTKLPKPALPTFEKLNATLLENLRQKLKCKDKDDSYQIVQHGSFWLLKNFVKSSKPVQCHESITYTTHSDFSFLDNLVPLLDRWQGPVSLALWSPGEYFNVTVDSILFLRNCLDNKSHLVRQFTTFHMFFDAKFLPSVIPRDIAEAERDFVCPDREPFLNFPHEKTFKSANNLTYPVNVARNLAREAALTHFVLASDIELYPNPGLIGQFFQMILKDPDKYLHKRNAFVLPIFEVGREQIVPSNKSELIRLYHKESAIWFHFKICPTCHSIPKADEWIRDNDDERAMRVFTTTKRQGRFDHWEPIFIGTNDEPFYDERLSWEGKSDKMTQAYIMCLLDYDFSVLSKGFLVHKPGIKTVKEAARADLEQQNKNLIATAILPEIKMFYGERKGCRVNS